MRGFGFPAALEGVLDELDWGRLRVGRFSEADERLMRELVQGKSGRDFLKLMGAGVDVTRHAHHSSRPLMPPRGEGPARDPAGVTFAFSHRMVTGRYIPDLSRSRMYVEGSAAALREAAARYDPSARRADGGRGAWYVKPGSPLGSGMQLSIGVVPGAKGLGAGAARRFQAYIERDAAAVYNVGTIAEDRQSRLAFWDHLERIERAGGRIQGRIIAELPHDAALGDDGRQRIVERFALLFREAGVPFHAVIHAPDRHGDARNWHMHLLYADRQRDQSGRLQQRKWGEARQRDFIRKLRERWADAVNEEFRTLGLRKRYDPRSYRDAGLNKPTGAHLGPAAAGLERRGIATVAGTRTGSAEVIWRYLQIADRVRSQADQLLRRMEPVREKLVALPADQVQLGTSAIRAAGQFAEAAEIALQKERELLVCIARRQAASGRAADFVRRLRRAERDGPAGTRSIAASARARAEAAGAAIVRAASKEEAAARRAAGEAIARLTRSGQILEAEHAVFDLARHKARLMAARAGLEDGRIGHEEAVNQERAAERRVASAVRQEVEARAALLKRIAAAFGRGTAGNEWRETLDNDAQRKLARSQLLAAAEGASPRRASMIRSIIESCDALDRAVGLRQKEEGALARMKRRHAVRRRSPEEESRLAAQVAAAEAGFERALRVCAGVPLALNLARARGVIDRAAERRDGRVNEG